MVILGGGAVSYERGTPVQSSGDMQLGRTGVVGDQEGGFSQKDL